MIFFISLNILFLGVYLIVWTIKSFDYKNHKTKNYIDGDGADSMEVILLKQAANALFNLLPVSVMKIIIIIFSIVLCILAGLLFSVLFQL